MLKEMHSVLKQHASALDMPMRDVPSVARTRPLLYKQITLKDYRLQERATRRILSRYMMQLKQYRCMQTIVQVYGGPCQLKCCKTTDYYYIS